jgi:hypothetical protein
MAWRIAGQKDKGDPYGSPFLLPDFTGLMASGRFRLSAC